MENVSLSELIVYQIWPHAQVKPLHSSQITVISGRLPAGNLLILH